MHRSGVLRTKLPVRVGEVDGTNAILIESEAIRSNKERHNGTSCGERESSSPLRSLFSLILVFPAFQHSELHNRPLDLTSGLYSKRLDKTPLDRKDASVRIGRD
ncbi:MAG: hypothetical protein ABI469_02175 [Gemmatimonadales bacterium]